MEQTDEMALTARVVALFLSLALSLPNPAFALRPPNAGMEENNPVNDELTRALGHPVLTRAAAGMEEDPLPEDFEYQPVPIQSVPKLLKGLEKLNRVDEYRNRLFRNSTGQLFLIKRSWPAIDSEKMKLHASLWFEKSSPTREYLAFRVARALQANVVDVVMLPNEQEDRLRKYIDASPDDSVYLVRLSMDYRRIDDTVYRKDPKQAFTRILLAALFMRKWDFHDGNLGWLGDADVPMMFDNDQAFHPSVARIESFVGIFNDHYFGRRFGIDPNLLLQRVDLQELADAVNEAESLDLDQLSQEIGNNLSGTPSDPAKNMFIILHFLPYLVYLRERQKSIRKDTQEFFRQIISGGKDASVEPLISEDQILVALLVPKASFHDRNSTTGLEERDALLNATREADKDVVWVSGLSHSDWQRGIDGVQTQP